MREISYAPWYYQTHPEMKRIHSAEKIGNFLGSKKVKMTLGAIAFWVWTLLPQAAHSQESSDILPWTELSGSAKIYNAPQIEAWIISILLKAAAAWFDMDNFRYEMTINPSIKDEIHVLSNPLFLATTRAISRGFLIETWINLEMIDVIAIAKVVQTKFSFASDPLLFEDTLLDFLSHYSAHQDAFSKILWKYLSDAVT